MSTFYCGFTCCIGLQKSLLIHLRSFANSATYRQCLLSIQVQTSFLLRTFQRAKICLATRGPQKDTSGLSLKSHNFCNNFSYCCTAVIFLPSTPFTKQSHTKQDTHGELMDCKLTGDAVPDSSAENENGLSSVW